MNILNNLKVYRANIKDLKEITSLRKNTIEVINSKYLEKSDLQVLKTMNSYKNLLRRIKSADMFYIKKNNKIIGTIDIKNNMIKGLYIDSNHQSQGLGSFLLNFIEDYAKNKGIKKLILDSNESSVNFYLKKGYILKKKRLPSGKMIKRTIFLMEKKI